MLESIMLFIPIMYLPYSRPVSMLFYAGASQERDIPEDFVVLWKKVFGRDFSPGFHFLPCL